MWGQHRRQVVVITGASSGIGRATAMAFSARGAVVVLAARGLQALESVAAECRAVGGLPDLVPTDVTVEEDVERLADEAVRTHGRIDVWVNNAAVSLFARFAEEPFDQFRRVMEVNALGTALGARAALSRFREQGAGILINVGSVLSMVPAPYQIAHVMSKHAIEALSGSLRCELGDAPRIHVSTVIPGSVDTPLFDHAANHMGRDIAMMRPFSQPERVAAAIVRCARRPRRQVRVGWVPRLARLSALLPQFVTERAIAAAVRKGHFTDQPVEASAGNLYEPARAEGRTKAGKEKPPRGRTAVVGVSTALMVAGLLRARR